MAIVEIPARKGKAARVRKGQMVKVINTRGAPSNRMISASSG